MAIVVQKYGGTSLRDDYGRERVAWWVHQALNEGFQPVVVVSAMGRRGDPYATDTLLDLIAGLPSAPPCEEDRLLACGEILSTIIIAGYLRQQHIACKTFNGGQAGITTDDHFGNARILAVEPTRVQKALQNQMVPVIAGFQGVTKDGKVTTLGRGGSDTTAVALGAALHAEMVDIFTDVNGVMTADPRIVPEARTIRQINYEEVFQMANLGARVIHPRAVEIARQFGVPIRIRSTFESSPGTLIAADPERLDPWGHRHPNQSVSGVTHLEYLVQFRVSPPVATPDHVPWALTVFTSLGTHEISVDMINVFPKEAYFCVPETLAGATKDVLDSLSMEFTCYPNRAKVSVVGSAIRGLPGVMGVVMSALAEVGVQTLQTSDSYATISVLIDRQQMEPAVQALHRKFGLG